MEYEFKVGDIVQVNKDLCKRLGLLTSKRDYLTISRIDSNDNWGTEVKSKKVYWFIEKDSYVLPGDVLKLTEYYILIMELKELYD